MWEFFFKLNPKFIRYYKGNDDLFECFMEEALDRGYVPSFSDIKANYRILDFINNDDDLKEQIIRKNPKCVTLLQNVSDKLIQIAIDCGYRPRVKDVKYMCDLSDNAVIMRSLIKKNPKNVIYYTGRDKKVIDEALNLGWKPNKRQIKKSTSLTGNEFVMKKLIDKDPSSIILYDCCSEKLIDYALQKGFVPKSKDIKGYSNLTYHTGVMRKFIQKNPRNIIFYTGKDESLIQEALDLGYVPKEHEIKDTNLVLSKKVMRMLIKKNPKSVLLYDGHDPSLMLEAIELGYRPVLKDMEDNFNVFASDEVLESLIKIDPNYIVFITKNNPKMIAKAIELGYVPKVEDVEKNDSLSFSDQIMRVLIEQDSKNIIHYTGMNSELFEIAIKDGFVPTIDTIKSNTSLARNDYIMRDMVLQDPSAIIYYRGTNQEIFSLAIEQGFKVTKRDLYTYSHFCKSDKIMQMVIEEDVDAIKLYTGENQELINLAISKGYKPKKKDLIKNVALAKNPLIMDILIKEDAKNLNLYKRFDDDTMLLSLQTFEQIYGVDVPDKYAEVFKVYKVDLSNFCFNYDKFSNFLTELGVEEEAFFQYAFSKSYNWLGDMIQILDSGKLEEFKKIKNYLFENYYFSSSIQKEAADVKAFLSVLSNYSKYPELCNDIVNRNVPLSQTEINNLNMLFNLSNVFDDSNKPMVVGDLENVVFSIKNAYREKLSSNLDIDSMRDTLCQLLFNAGQIEVEERLSIFGDTKVLRQLLFNNRNHPEMEDMIRKMIVYTSMMESVLGKNDQRVLRDVVDRVLDNFEKVVKVATQFSNYEEEMRNLYEMDIQSNLTKFNNIKDLNLVIDKEKSAKYGVEVLDFSDKKYCLLVHVMSRRETPEELIGGVASNKKNFICLSSISNRNQVYYTNPGNNKIIFATDVLPNGLFLQSSTSNMGSNHHISSSDGEVDEILRTQRGILETSHAPRGNNSEILTYRSGLKFNYIVLHGGREPTETELALARENGLKFIVTQGVREAIKDPVDIEMKDTKEKVVVKKEDLSIEEMNKQLFSNDRENKSIAILTDAHGLFEPTLAVLEDARKRGITEIYSLGDNIGAGPNPSEVMDLLEEYGVVSLAGNHELYVSLGVDAFKEHLDKKGAYAGAKENSSWTAGQLTEEQKQRLRVYPKMLEVSLGGKNILLCHDIRDFNTDEIIVDPKTYDEVFRGHIHFSKNEGNVTTIPGVGIGTNKGQATYLVLMEKEGGGYTSQVVTVDYDKENMRHGIIESGMSDFDKSKIESWAGVSDGTRKK